MKTLFFLHDNVYKIHFKCDKNYKMLKNCTRGESLLFENLVERLNLIKFHVIDDHREKASILSK